MIPVCSFQGKTVLVFGLGGSGLATVQALLNGGAEVLCFDDKQSQTERARVDGATVQDLRDYDFSKAEALVLAPGVPLTHPEPHWSVEKARAAGIEVIGDVELFCRERRNLEPRSELIAVTGTNGKSTTTALVAHILSVAGRNVQMGGNIGRAVLTLDPPEADTFYVVECSSYQIDLAPSLDPTIGVHLNLSPDHIDRHGTFENYAAIKARLIMGSRFATVGIDDEASLYIANSARKAGVTCETVSLHPSSGAEITGSNGHIFVGGKSVLEVEGIASLRGGHNLQNAALAFSVCRKAGLSDEEIQQGISTFPGLAHRAEQVAERNGVLYINDSKATNAEATARALASFDEILWIAGGREKDGGISSLNGFFPKIRQAFLIGEAAQNFAVTLEGKVPFVISGTLDRAVRDAVSAASNLFPANGERTQAVVFSPACSSFDQFANFEVRGEAFKSAVRSILGQE